MQAVTTNSFEETQAFAKKYAQSLEEGTVLCLYGDLGYGKTTFVQGLAKGLGIEKKILSPTFIIMRTYEIKVKSQKSKVESTNKKLKNLYHVDLYRTSSEQEIIDLGLVELMQDRENIVVIEWPEKLGKWLPEKRIDVKLDYIDENKRKIIIDF